MKSLSDLGASAVILMSSGGVKTAGAQKDIYGDESSH